ncbi:hypothetical protein BLA29_007841, partial [Euroglyphus maynei]
EKHLIICQKIKEKKRKLFDAAKQRAENLDKINLVPTEINVIEQNAVSKSKNNVNNKTTNNGGGKKKPTTTKTTTGNNDTMKKQSNWRQQHQEFIRTIRAARGAQQQSGAIPPGFTECPTCQRRFSIKAADRHIEWCAESQHKQRQRQQNVAKNQEALERMKARTKKF